MTAGNPTGGAQRLESMLQEEHGAQRRLVQLLSEQEQAIVAGDRDELCRTATGIEAELAAEGARRRRREALVEQLSRALGAPTGASTVSSLSERLAAAGEPVERVRRLRDELRETVLDVRRRARRITVVATEHGELLNDVLRVLVGADDGVSEGGLLVNAEA